MNQDLFASANFLLAESNHGYGTLPIPQQRDGEITDILWKWIALDDSAREEAASHLLNDQRLVLLAYSERMASLAVRQRKEDFLVLGLLALGIDGCRADWRDNVLVMCLHYDAAQRIGASVDGVFAKAASLLPTKAADALRAFTHRAPEDKSLKAMGYIAGQDGDGFRYRRTW